MDPSSHALNGSSLEAEGGDVDVIVQVRSTLLFGLLMIYGFDIHVQGVDDRRRSVLLLGSWRRFSRRSDRCRRGVPVQLSAFSYSQPKATPTLASIQDEH